MAELEKLLPDKIRKNQYLVFAVLALIATVIISMWVVVGGKSKEIAIDMEKATRIEISKVTGGVKAEDRWLQAAEEQLKGLKKQIEVMAQERKNLEAKMSELKQEMSRQDEDGMANTDPHSEEIARLRQEIEALKGIKNQSLQTELSEVTAKRIKTIELKPDANNGTKFSLYGYLPAGSHAEAVVISGVDASVGVNSQSDPRPALFRITSHANSASNDGRVQKTDITGCTVTGAASGDLSSERVFIRLLKMTCSREDGVVTETEVKGYVAGVGKAGIRGEVVSREGDFVMQGFLAGVASGVGAGAAQSFAAPTSIFGSTHKEEIKDIAGAGLGKGVESSGNRVSNYLIKRAEQYQPVISIPSGIEVELVFTEGVYLNGEKVNEKN